MQWSVLPLLAGLVAVVLIFGGAPTVSPPAVSAPTTLVVVDPDGNILDPHGLSVMELLEREYGGDVVTPFTPLATLVLMDQADAYASEMVDWTAALSNLSREVEGASLAATLIAGTSDPRCVDLPSELAAIGLWKDAELLLKVNPEYAPQVLGLVGELKMDGVDSDDTFMEISVRGEWDAVGPVVSSRGALLRVLWILENRTESALFSLEQGLGDPTELSSMLSEGLNSTLVGRVENATAAAGIGDLSGVRRNLTGLGGLLTDASPYLVSLTNYSSTVTELVSELGILNLTLNAVWEASSLLDSGRTEEALRILEDLEAGLVGLEAHLSTQAGLGGAEVRLASLAPHVSPSPLLSLLLANWSVSAAGAAQPLSGLEGDQSPLSGAFLVIGELDEFEPWTMHPMQPSIEDAESFLLRDPTRALGICSRVLEAGTPGIRRGLEIALREEGMLNDIYASAGSVLNIIADTTLGRKLGLIKAWSTAQKFRLRGIEEEFSLLAGMGGELDRLGAWLRQSLFGGIGLSFAAGAIFLAEDHVEEVVETLEGEGFEVELVGPETVSQDLLSSCLRIILYSTIISLLSTLLYSFRSTSSLRISLLASLVPPSASYGALRLGRPGVLEASFMYPSLLAVSSVLTLLTIQAVTERLNSGFGRREALRAILLRPGVWHVSVLSAAVLGISSPLYLFAVLLTALLILALPVPGFLLAGGGRRRIPPATPRGPLVRLTVLCYRNRFLALVILALLLLPVIWVGPQPGSLDYLPRGSATARALDVLLRQASVPGPAVLGRSPPEEGGFLNLTPILALRGGEVGHRSYAFFRGLGEGWLGTAVLGGAPDPGPSELWVIILMLVPLVLAVRKVGLMPSLLIFPLSLATVGVLGLFGIPAPPTTPFLAPMSVLAILVGWAELGAGGGHPLDFKKRLTWRFQALAPAAFASLLPLAALAVFQGVAGLSAALSSFLAAVSALPAFSALSSFSAGNH